MQEREQGWKNRTSRDSYTSKLQCLQLMGISLTRDALYKRVQRQQKRQPNKTATPIDELVIPQNDPEISSVSSPSSGHNSNDSNIGSDDIPETMILSSKAGRPKGSTVQKKRANIKSYGECVNAISQAYNIELTQHKEQKKRLMRGYFEQLIQERKDEFGVNTNISVNTVRSQMKRGNLAPTHPGTSSLLCNAELALVGICKQMGKIRQPLTGEEAIAIMNDMIRGSEMSETLTEFQKVRT